MTALLASFQAGFARALFAPEDVSDPAVKALTDQPAFAVYRNTVMKGCIDALESNFPAVARLVGSEWFRAAAAVYVAAEPPRDGRLLRYGASFADFLKGFGPAAELGYLPDVARLDVLWRESHAAGGAAPLDPARIAQCAPEQLAKLVVAPHPAARWAWFPECPAYTIWSRNRVAAEDAESANESHELVWSAEGALLTRPADGVVWRAIGKAECAFLEACAGGSALAEAADRALAADPEADLSALIERLLRAGALTDTSPPT